MAATKPLIQTHTIVACTLVMDWCLGGTGTVCACGHSTAECGADEIEAYDNCAVCSSSLSRSGRAQMGHTESTSKNLIVWVFSAGHKYELRRRFFYDVVFKSE
jgi:hypothetical protein